MARLAIIQRQLSQVDEPVYAKMHALDGDALAVVYWNDYGLVRRSNDPEIGLVPDLKDEFAGDYPRCWLDSRCHALGHVIAELERHQPRLVLVSDLPQRDRLRLSVHLRTRGLRLAFRTDKNHLSETVSSGLRYALEKQVTRRAYDILAPASPLTTAYYAWPAGRPVVPFPYTTNEEKFAPAAAERERRREATRRRLGVAPDAFTFLSVAKFAARENPFAVVKAFEEVVVERPRARLVAVGDGPMLAEVKAYCAGKPALRDVVFPGFVPFRQLQDYMFAADTFLHLAGIEPWGLSPQDALVAGLPIITSDRVGAGEVLLTGDLRRFMVAPSDTAATAERMLELSRGGGAADVFAPASAAAQDYTSMICARRWVDASRPGGVA